MVCERSTCRHWRPAHRERSARPYLRFMVDNRLEEKLATGYRRFLEEVRFLRASRRLPDVFALQGAADTRTHDLTTS